MGGKANIEAVTGESTGVVKTARKGARTRAITGAGAGAATKSVLEESIGTKTEAKWGWNSSKNRGW